MAAQGGGGGGGVHRQKFFKILLPGSFESRLCLPLKFTASLRCPPGGATATLRDPAGLSREVMLDRCSDGVSRLCFAGSGWRSFVADNGLSDGHLLVFDHRGGLEFAVEMFDASGCLVDDNSVQSGHRGTRTAENNAAGAVDMETGSSSDWSYPHAGIKRKLSPVTVASPSAAGSCQRSEDDLSTLRCHIQSSSQLTFLDLTKIFCDRVGWASSRTARLTVAGGERRWDVTVIVATKGGVITRGWMQFAQDNGVRVTDTCVFFPPRADDQPVQVQILRGLAQDHDLNKRF